MPKLPPPPRMAPEEVGVLLLAGGEELALGRHQVDREEVVDRRAVLSHEPADTAAKVSPAMPVWVTIPPTVANP